ncbi:MAG: hypothetical protein Q9181_001031 [Wetmoreana brouardii]
MPVSSSSLSPPTSITRSPAFSRRNVETPITTTNQLIPAILSLPLVPARLIPPVIPEPLKFHQRNGFAKRTLTKPRTPTLAKPFKKCSAHDDGSSSSKMIGSNLAPNSANGLEEMNQYGSR